MRTLLIRKKQFEFGAPNIKTPGPGQGTVGAAMKGSKSTGYRTKIVDLGNAKRGDLLRVGGKTFKVRYGSMQDAFDQTPVVAATTRSGETANFKTPKGSVIFRWIGGRVVPIKVK